MAASTPADVVEVLKCGCKLKRLAGSNSIDILLCPVHSGWLAAGRDVRLARGGKKRDLCLESVGEDTNGRSTH